MNFQGEAIVTVTDKKGNEKIYKQTNTVSNDLLKAIYRVMVAGEKFPFIYCPGGIGLDITDNGSYSTSTAGFNHGIGGSSSMWLSSFADYGIQASGGGAVADYMTFAFSSSNEQEIVTYTVDGIAGSELSSLASTITAIRLLGSPLNYPFTGDANTRTTFLANITALNIGFATTDSIKIEYILKTPAGRGDEAVETLVSGWSRRFLKGMINTIARGATYQDELINGSNDTRESTNTLRISGAYLMETTTAQSGFSSADNTELQDANNAFTKAIPNTMNEFNATTPTKTEASNFDQSSSVYNIANAGTPVSNCTLGTAGQVAYIPDGDFKIGTISLAPDTQTSASPFEVTLAQTWTAVANTAQPNAINIYARRYDETNNRFIPLNNVAPTDGATGGIDVVYRIIPDSSSLTGWSTGDNVTANLKFKISALSS